jgi:hypothetical protein
VGRSQKNEIIRAEEIIYSTRHYVFSKEMFCKPTLKRYPNLEIYD